VGYLYLMMILPAALLVLVLWYALVVGWALILRRMAQSVSTWDELEEDDAGGRLKESLDKDLETRRSLKSRCTRAI
jgi:hypothetical protein